MDLRNIRTIAMFMITSRNLNTEFIPDHALQHQILHAHHLLLSGYRY
jgi:hypothetical protein